MKGETDNSDDMVGYKKPPRRTQFKPGQSGNPKGRPKKTSTLTGVFSKHVKKRVMITMGEKVQTVALLDAIAMKHISKAANGDHKSTALVFDALKPLENDQDNNIPELLQQFRAIHASRVAADQARVPPVDSNDTKTQE
jgi:hypothetical protein